MPAPHPLNRREFLLLKTRSGRSFELSCERLYMRYVDSLVDDTTLELFARLESELSDVNEVWVVDREWLAREDLRARLDPLLRTAASRGVRIRR